MKIPFKYSIKSFGSRRLTTFITVSGIALVVFVFAAVLMMAYGVQKTLVSTGLDDNVKIVRKGSNGEISSIIGGDTQNIISTLPYIAKTSEEKPIISYEPVVIINLNKISLGLSNVTVRGVSPVSTYLRPQVKIIEGKMFNPSLRELIVGESIAKNFAGAKLGKYIKFANNEWKVVGIFSSGGSGFDSEIWGDAVQLLDAFKRGNTVSSLTLKLDNPNNYEKFKKAFELDRRLQQFEPKIETVYFEEQSEALANFIRILGIFITIIFSAGATIGAMITMYAAVANRTIEVGTMRALGFARRSILTVFLTESILISVIGGMAGIFIAFFLQFFSISTLNFTSFSEITFSFALSPRIIVYSLIFSILMGFIGGFLPSVRAARLNIVNALREA
jgi:putative ABC transport system permease protein